MHLICPLSLPPARRDSYQGKHPAHDKAPPKGAKVMPNTSAYPAAAAVRKAGTTRPPQPRHHVATWVRGQRGTLAAVRIEKHHPGAEAESAMAHPS